MEPSLLGQILLDFNLISEDQLAECVQLQNSPDPRPLGELLIEQGHIDEKALRSILSVQRRKIAIDKAQGRLSNAELERRLKEADVTGYLQVARELGASDLLLISQVPPALRLHGTLVDLPGEALDRNTCQELLLSLLSRREVERYYQDKQVNVCLDLPGAGRVRAGIYRHLEGIGGAFRLLPQEPPRFEDLGLPASVRRFVEFSHGLVLITGPSGCGKSTTLAALIDLINESQRSHVITIEQPIEVVHHNKSSLISQIEVGRHVDTFQGALRSALREDPDVIVVGDLRDPEITATALTAAETGHLVFATMHTRSATRTLLRVLDQYPADKRDHVRSLLASSLRAVVSQQLIPNADGKGRSLAVEVLLANAAVSNLLREKRIWQIPMVIQTNRGQEMRDLDDSLRELVEAGTITVQEALSRATDRQRILVES